LEPMVVEQGLQLGERSRLEDVLEVGVPDPDPLEPGPLRLGAAVGDVEQAPLPASVHLHRPGGRPVQRDQVVAHASFAAMPRAILWAAASIVTIGFTPRPVGSAEPSTTNRLVASQASPVGSHTAVSRDLPMWAVPIRWKAPRVTWAAPQPQ